MSEEQPKYSDPGDRVDYQVIKSYGGASRYSARNNLYSTATFVIIVLFFLMTTFQARRISDLEKRASELETKVVNLETKVTNLESQKK